MVESVDSVFQQILHLRNELQHDIEDRNRKINEFEEILKDLIKEKKIINEYPNLLQKVESLEKSLNKKDNETVFKDLKQKVETLEKKLSEKDNIIENYEKLNHSSNEFYKDLKQKVETLEKKLSEKDSIIDNCEKLNETSSESFKDLKQKVDTLEKKLSEKDIIIEKLNQTSNESYKVLKQKVETLDNDLKRHENNFKILKTWKPKSKTPENNVCDPIRIEKDNFAELEKEDMSRKQEIWGTQRKQKDTFKTKSIIDNRCKSKAILKYNENEDLIALSEMIRSSEKSTCPIVQDSVRHMKIKLERLKRKVIRNEEDQQMDGTSTVKKSRGVCTQVSAQIQGI